MTETFRRRPSATAILLLLLLASCSGKPAETWPVEGTLTLDGQPLSSGSVMFQPVAPSADGQLHSARATIRPDGSYRLTTFETDDGAVAGRHRVSVMVPVTAPDQNPNAAAPLPVKYTNPATSGLEYEVHPEPNRIDVELSSTE